MRLTIFEYIFNYLVIALCPPNSDIEQDHGVGR